ncbi:MAG: alpha/beta hydrolase [Acidobacteria bacterium]|nr:alpha/beta hydrolase [Acidobacteriota bacterium]
MKLLFFSGGPGLNPRGEEVLLSAPLQAAGFEPHFFYEPSRLRPEGSAYQSDDAYGNYLHHAERALDAVADDAATLAGHSFGCHAVHHLALQFPDRVSSAAFIASGLVIRAADRNMMEVARADFAAERDPRAERLAELLTLYSGEFDSATEAAFRLIGDDSRLYEHYWSRKDSMAEYFGCLSDPRYVFDVDCFFDVRRSYRPPAQQRSTVPALALFGEGDEIISADAEVEFLERCYPDLRTTTFRGAGHYPHVENREQFVEVLSELVQDVSRR